MTACVDILLTHCSDRGSVVRILWSRYTGLRLLSLDTPFINQEEAFVITNAATSSIFLHSNPLHRLALIASQKRL